MDPLNPYCSGNIIPNFHLWRKFVCPELGIIREIVKLLLQKVKIKLRVLCKHVQYSLVHNLDAVVLKLDVTTLFLGPTKDQRMAKINLSIGNI